jgi:hypothetical protein
MEAALLPADLDFKDHAAVEQTWLRYVHDLIPAGSAHHADAGDATQLPVAHARLPPELLPRKAPAIGSQLPPQ